MIQRMATAARPASGLLSHRAALLCVAPLARPSRLYGQVSCAATVTPLPRLFSSSCAYGEQHQHQEEGMPGTPIGKVEPKLSLTFTCTVTDCGHRSSHEFSKRSYEKGIVLVQCPSCKNRHLIADHLSWFTENASDPKTIEEMVSAKGGKVKRGVNYVDGEGYETMEIYEDGEKGTK